MNANALRQEAAQYGLLCRISSSLRHRLLGKLQPIGIMAALVDRQLQGDTPNLAGARDNLAKTQQRVREATHSSIATLAWLTGEEATTIALTAGVAECVDLIRTDSQMRGVTIVSTVSGVEASVSRPALRLVLTAVLIGTVDMTPAPARVALRSTVAGKQIELCLDLSYVDAADTVDSADTLDTLSRPPDQRLLNWDDVQALAQGAGVVVVRSSDPPMVKCQFDVIAAEARAGDVKNGVASTS